MRNDLDKVIVERPRRGGGLKPKGFKEKILIQDEEGIVENSPSHESMRKKFKASGVQKGFSDHLQPLIRFIEKNVGRPWNKVYSELCHNFNKRTLTGWHLDTHVKQYVETNVYMKEGKAFDGASNREVWASYFYVNPETGLLCAPKKKKKKTYSYNTTFTLKFYHNKENLIQLIIKYLAKHYPQQATFERDNSVTKNFVLGKLGTIDNTQVVIKLTFSSLEELNTIGSDKEFLKLYKKCAIMPNDKAEFFTVHNRAEYSFGFKLPPKPKVTLEEAMKSYLAREEEKYRIRKEQREKEHQQRLAEIRRKYADVNS